MIDVNLIRTNPELVKENMRRKFQDHKLHLVDEVLKLDLRNRQLKQIGDDCRAYKNKVSSQIGQCMKERRLDKADELKKLVQEENRKIEAV
ncbi:MAG: serine--tRNA ligase, partial [Clostridia bacterium]|nr:serine--tRNA ligase [Clostridia bacterium]